MNKIGAKGLVACLATALGLTVLSSSSLLGQFTDDTGRSETEYFVTGEVDIAHVWVRDGLDLRCVGHGKCEMPGDRRHNRGVDVKQKTKP